MAPARVARAQRCAQRLDRRRSASRPRRTPSPPRALACPSASRRVDAARRARSAPISRGTPGPASPTSPMSPSTSQRGAGRCARARRSRRASNRDWRCSVSSITAPPPASRSATQPPGHRAKRCEAARDRRAAERRRRARPRAAASALRAIVPPGDAQRDARVARRRRERRARCRRHRARMRARARRPAASRPKVTTRAPARRAASRHDVGARVVGVDDRDAVARQAPRSISACSARDVVDAAHEFLVLALRVVDERDRRLRDAREVARLAAMVHADLDHRVARCAARRRSSVSGRPMSLLRLPRRREHARRRRSARARIAAIISFTVVLPLLPVTTTSGSAKRARQCAASAPERRPRIGDRDEGAASAGALRARRRAPRRRRARAPARRSRGRRSARPSARRRGRPGERAAVGGDARERARCVADDAAAARRAAAVGGIHHATLRRRERRARRSARSENGCAHAGDSW